MSGELEREQILSVDLGLELSPRCDIQDLPGPRRIHTKKPK